MDSRIKSLRRQVRRIRRTAGKATVASAQHLQEHLSGRGSHLRSARGKIIAWVLIALLLIGASALQIIWNTRAYTVMAGANGGDYLEGSVGPLTTTNPILAETSAERSVSRLLFTGLFDYDASGTIEPALANDIQTSDAKTFTLHLKKGIKWSDGYQFTSKDVVYTVGLIQNDAVRSPLQSSWQNIKVSAPDDYTVVFTLPFAYIPFVHSLTFGMLPEHVLSGSNPSDLRTSDFNFNPVSLGQFTLTRIRQSDASGNTAVYMAANTKYFRGSPRVERFQLYVYPTQAAMVKAFQSREVAAVAGVSVASVQSSLKSRHDVKDIDAPIDNGDFALFNTKSPLYSDANLRAAVRLGTNPTLIRHILGNRVGELNDPILPSEVPGVADLAQQTSNPAEANKALDALGWTKGANGLRQKDGQPLRLTAVAVNSGDYPAILTELARQWRMLGIDVQTNLVDSANVTQQIIKPRAFDVLVYELELGADPDEYAYWDSTQVDELNFSGYSSGVADDALSSARDRLDPALRNAKYIAFTKQWLADTPAIALFQSNYHYLSSNAVSSIAPNQTLVSSLDRYATVDDWTIDQSNVFTTP